MNKDTEIFQDIPGYVGYYQASTFSRIKSLKRAVVYSNGAKHYQEEIILKQSMMCNYFAVSLYKDGKMKSFYVHQLLAMTFYDHKPNGHAAIIDHLDSDPLNNNVDNLRITTNRINTVRGKLCQNTSSKYVGVGWHKGAQKFQGRIWINGKRVHLGYSKSALTCSVLYQRKLIQIGEFIRTGSVIDFIKVIDPADTWPMDGIFELA